MKRDTDIQYTHFLMTGMTETWSAEFSLCQLYRYTLSRVWDSKLALLVYILLNPSTATHERNDPTITRCITRALEWGYGGVVVLNAFAWRDTSPKAMLAAFDPVGQYNDEVILEVCKAAPLVICGWGKHGTHRGRDARVLALLREHGITPWALGFNIDGTPKHPLYVPYEASLQQIPPKVMVAS
jgi:hypothetical protein